MAVCGQNTCNSTIIFIIAEKEVNWLEYSLSCFVHKNYLDSAIQNHGVAWIKIKRRASSFLLKSKLNNMQLYKLQILRKCYCFLKHLIVL